jgi:hypothetical protein
MYWGAPARAVTGTSGRAIERTVDFVPVRIGDREYTTHRETARPGGSCLD